MIDSQEYFLINKIKKGDRRAEEIIIKNYLQKIEFTIRRKGIKEEDCHEIVNNTCIAIIESLRIGGFVDQKDTSLASYIYGITRNKISDYYKLKQKDRIIRDNPPKDFEWSAKEDSKFEKEETRNILKKCIGKLKKKYQEVLYLRYYEDLSIGEISDKIGIPTRRVSERINYAIKLLKKECEKENYFSILFSPFIICI